MARIPQVASSNETTAKMVINARNVGLTREQFGRLCHDNRDLRLELTARKEIVIMTPVRTRTGWQEGEICRQLASWAATDGTGIAFGPNTGFTLPNGAIRAPDASWMPMERWRSLPPEEQDSFAAVVPDFVVELRSGSDTIGELREKISEYLESGVLLAWLIDPVDRHVDVFRPGRDVARIDAPSRIEADPVLPGFFLDLDRVW